ncbi:MAG: glycosyltransferase family 4 protein [Alphaproteobacteria bacterium]
MTPRVLHVLPELDQGGGIERYIVDFAKGVCKNEIPFYVSSCGGEFVSVIEEMNGCHYTLPLKKRNPLTIALNTIRLRKLIKQNKIDVIHAHSRAPAWSSFFAARTLKYPFVTTYHGIYNSSNFLKAFYNSVMARGDYVIAISKFVLNHIKKHHNVKNKNLHLIYEGIDTDYFSPKRISKSEIENLRHKWKIPFDRKIILLPGRLTRWKGQSVLLEALRFLSCDNIFVILLGDDQGRIEYKKELELLAKSYPVCLIKHCSQMPLAYAISDIVVSCSTDPEAFGRTTAEALSMECLFIGANHGATPEMCCNNKTGFLVTPNKPKELAHMIQYVLSLQDYRKKEITHNAREHIKASFNFVNTVKETILLYNCIDTR